MPVNTGHKIFGVSQPSGVWLWQGNAGVPFLLNVGESPTVADQSRLQTARMVEAHQLWEI